MILPIRMEYTDFSKRVLLILLTFIFVFISGCANVHPKIKSPSSLKEKKQTEKFDLWRAEKNKRYEAWKIKQTNDAHRKKKESLKYMTEKRRKKYSIFKETGMASWYGKEYHQKGTSSGEPFNMNDFTAAHRNLPFGTFVTVRNLENGKSVRVRITDRGPFIRGRIINLSYKAAASLDMVNRGVAKVKLVLDN